MEIWSFGDNPEKTFHVFFSQLVTVIRHTETANRRQLATKLVDGDKYVFR